MKIALAFCLLGAIPALGGGVIELDRHLPCNLFGLDEPVEFKATFKGLPAGEGKATVELTDFFNKTKTVVVPIKITPGQTPQMPLTLGVQAPGYYGIELTAEIPGPDGKTVAAKSAPGSFGVVKFDNLTSAQALESGLRFGLKVFQIGAPGVWWRKPLVWNLQEVVDASARSGFHWTRQQFNQNSDPAQPGKIGSTELIEKAPMNAVLKVEGFPENCFDTARYGPFEEWKTKYKNKNWSRCTVPAKGPYQEWLKGELAKIPASQNIFEIGNEVWNYMSAEEFADWCKMTVSAIKEARPGAKIGADPGNGDEYSKRFLAAGGMDGMTLWFSHPYSFTPLPEHRVRGFVRNMRDILKTQTGRDFDLYVTEYGWSVAPKSTKAGVVSELLQAQRTTRQSLMLYAEDSKVLIPHSMGDREQDPADWDQWFGFLHLDQQPRPVFVAHSACARIIDGSKFVGDLPLGEGVGAMLFERGGKFTLALWTAEEVKNVTVDVVAPNVTVVDVMGAEQQTETKKGKLELKLDGNVTYLVGVDSSLANLVIRPDQDLDQEVWSKRGETVQAAKMAKEPIIDGSLEDWSGRNAIPLAGSAPGCKAESLLGWDDNFVYAAIRVTGTTSGSREVFDFGLGTRPSRQPDMKSSLPYDYHFILSSSDGKKPATLAVNNSNFLKPLECKTENDPSGIRWAVQQTDSGWSGEMAIPVAFLKGLPTPIAKDKASIQLALQHFAAGAQKPATLSLGEDRPRLWPYVTFE